MDDTMKKKNYDWALSGVVAKEKGCVRHTIVAAARRGELVSHRVGQYLFIRRDARLERWKVNRMRQECSQMQPASIAARSGVVSEAGEAETDTTGQPAAESREEVPPSVSLAPT